MRAENAKPTRSEIGNIDFRGDILEVGPPAARSPRAA